MLPLSRVDTSRDDALIRLGLSAGLRVSEVITIRTSEIDFDHGPIKIWDEKRDKWHYVMPTVETKCVLRRYVSALDGHTQPLFFLNTKTVERIIQRYSKRDNVILRS